MAYAVLYLGYPSTALSATQRHGPSVAFCCGVFAYAAAMAVRQAAEGEL
jgi:hypothetical protein